MRRQEARLCVLLLSLVPGGALAHGTSKSFAEWTLSGDSAEMRLNFAAHDLTAAIPSLDANADQKLSAQELADGALDLGRRIAEGTQLSVGEGATRAACKALTPAVHGLGDPAEEVQVQLGFVCPARLAHLRLEAHYLPELDPPHVSVATFTGPGVAAQHVFAPATPVFDTSLELPPISVEIRAAFVRGLLAASRPSLVLLAFALLLSVGGLGRAAPLALGAALAISSVLAAGPALPARASELVAALVIAAAGIERWRLGPKARPHHYAYALLGGAAVGGALSAAQLLPNMVARLSAVAAAVPVFGVTFLVLGITLGWAERRAGAEALGPLGAGLAAAALALAGRALFWG